jgi:replicative DNA helicase
MRPGSGDVPVNVQLVPGAVRPLASVDDATASGLTVVRDDWDPPIPLRRGTLPDFPLHALPQPIREYVEAVSEQTQTPIALAALTALTAVASVVSGRIELTVWSGWTEPLNLWTMTVLPPGNRKSAVLGTILQPIYDLERQLLEQYRPTLAALAVRKSVAEKRLRRAEEAAASAKPEERAGTEADAIAARQELEALDLIAPPRLIVGDITPEAIAQRLAEQKGRLSIFSAEGGLFGNLNGRYSSNGGPNLDVVLAAHSGDSVRVDRIGRAGDVIDRPALSIGLAVQPDVLRDVTGNKAMRGRGLLARFLFAVPESTLGARSYEPHPIPDSLSQAWGTLIRRLFEMAEADVLPTLRLSHEAQMRLRYFAEQLEPRLHERSGDLAPIGDWAGKLVGQTARVAGLLHLAKAPNWTDTADADSVQAALDVAEWAILHAQAALGLIAHHNAIRAQALLNWIGRKGLQTFTSRDALRGLRSQAFPDSNAMKAATTILEEHRWIRLVEPESRLGRPSQVWDVNPLGRANSAGGPQDQ